MESVEELEERDASKANDQYCQYKNLPTLFSCLPSKNR